MAKKKHWASTRAGRARMREIQKAAWAKRRKAANATSASPSATVPRVKTGKQELIELARIGAALRLADIEREAVKLRAFLDAE